VKASTRTRLKILLIFVLVVGAFAVYLWIRVKRDAAHNNLVGVSVTPIPSPSLAPPAVTPSPATPFPTLSPEVPQVEPGFTSSPVGTDTPPAGSFVGQLSLVIPVAGVRPDQLIDTFADARSEGRVHDAIDIPAAAGTPVVAAIEGEIARLFQSERGGITIYQLSPDKKLVFYYAHLQRYADGVVAGKYVRQGEVIAYVGDSGNAGAGNFHLHFSIAALTDPKRYWEGTNINPYPLLRKQ
jgi:murein DD-endopeptidase MepM/ murein hydrolase activator NlpD